METLRWTKILFIVSGNNLRPTFRAPFQRCLYKIYANSGTLVLHSIFVVQVLDIVFNVNNLDEFTENFAITSMLFTVLLKRNMMCTRRANILSLIEMLDKSTFLPANKQETKIRMKFDKIIDWSVKMYTILISIFINGLFLVSLIVDFKERKLVSRIWLPYDYSSANLYLLSSAYEFVIGVFASFVTLSCECLYAGLALHICCQFEILEHRIKTIRGRNNYAVKHCASHHHRIYEYAEMVNDEFRRIVSVQFFFSTAVLCLNLYRITYAGNLTRFTEAVMFAVCVFSQIFYYCLYGDVVKAKSTEFSSEIFDSNWPSWNERSKKILLMIIRRSKTPIEFTSMHIVSLSLESFMSLLKTSYSAFNLLQTNR